MTIKQSLLLLFWLKYQLIFGKLFIGMQIYIFEGWSLYFKFCWDYFFDPYLFDIQNVP